MSESKVVIPEAAVQAAAEAIDAGGYECPRFAIARAALEAAAPYLMAQAWDEGADSMSCDGWSSEAAPSANPYRAAK